MSEKEKRIVEKLKDAIPNMSEFDKGYILGKTESFSENKLEKKTDKKETVNCAFTVIKEDKENEEI
jgi:hypothetical protein